MAIPDRKTLDEILVTLSFEPLIHDVIVEGESDKNILDWYLNEEYKSNNTQILSVNEIDIPQDIVEKYNGNSEDGNRGRIVAISKCAEEKLKNMDNLSCVIDADTDILLNKNNYAAAIIKTDFACMEMYFFNVALLKKFFKLYCGYKIKKDLLTIIKNFEDILVELFLIRAANKLLGLKMSWIDFDKYIEIKNEVITFRCDDFINNYLMSNSKHKELETFKNCISSLRAKITGDKRNYINGHDFTELLLKFIKNECKSKQTNKTALESSLRVSLQTSYIDNFILFKTLRKKSKIKTAN